MGPATLCSQHRLGKNKGLLQFSMAVLTKAARLHHCLKSRPATSLCATYLRANRLMTIDFGMLMSARHAGRHHAREAVSST